MQVDLDEDEGIEVQMAPLVDCVFLLLIFFLVATTLKKIDEELPLTLPDSAASIEVQQPDDFSVIALDHEATLYLDGAPIATGMLQDQLRSIAGGNPDHKIRLDVDKGVPFERVMEILDILRFEKLENVGINTRRQDSSGGY